MSAPKFLMCAPDFFGVDYVINPWMTGQIGTVNHAESVAQWNALCTILTEQAGAEIQLVAPQPGLPDMVFTANAGVIRADRVVPSRFRHSERQGEEPFFIAWFADQDLHVGDIDSAFEGAGDALAWIKPGGGSVLFAAAGFRTDLAAHDEVAEWLEVDIVSLNLVDPRFYHLDTCFCPLPSGHLVWFPAAFDEGSRAKVAGIIPESLRKAVTEEDAQNFACNAVGTDSAVVLHRASKDLEDWLIHTGVTVYQTPLDEFMKAGGSAKCLTLRLNEPI